MPDTQLYRKKIVEFLEKWNNVIPEKTRDDFFKLEQWVASYDKEIEKRNVEEKKIYHRRGISILSAIVENYKKDHIEFLQLLQSCRMKLLKNDPSCSVKTKNELSELVDEYRTFMSELIGCFKENDARYILTLSKNMASALGPEWNKKIQEIDQQCYQMRLDKLNQQ